MKQWQDYGRSLGIQAKRKVAKTIVGAIDNKPAQRKQSKSKFDFLPIKSGSTQDYMPFDFVRDGVIATSDGRFVSIIEVLATNFYKKSESAQIKIATHFGSIFGDSPEKLQIKIINDIVDTAALIRNLKKFKSTLTDETAIKAINEYMVFIRSSSSITSMQTRYFIIYEFEGEEKRFADIAQRMKERREQICQKLHLAGNITIDKVGKDLDEHLKDILYYFYNRRSAIEETRQDRSIRIERDIREYNKKVSGDKQYKHRQEDDIAPRGMDFTKSKNLFMDGYYYTFLGMKTNSYPKAVGLGWVDAFSQGNSVDVDLIFHRVPKQAADLGLKGYKRIEKMKYKSYASKGKDDEASEAASNYENASNISRSIRGNAELYNVAIILTIKAFTEKQLGEISRYIRNNMKSSYHIEFETSDACVEDYFTMTTPLLYFRRPWRRLHHNILSNEIATMYCFNNYQFHDPNGVVFGTNFTTQAMMVIDIFNSGIFNNANMLITGMPGSGKTFALHMLIERYFFNGANVYSIIPKKGEQYKQVCDICGGKYYDLTKDCINLMEIIPEKRIDTSVLSEKVNWQRSSLLAKKISFITTVLTLLADNGTITTKIANLIDAKLQELYKGFGITNDNASVWKDVKKRERKHMPIIQDMYEAFYATPELRFICEYLTPFVGNGKFSYLNRQSTIDESSRFIAFDCNEDVIGERMLPVIQSICCDYCYGRVKDPTSYKSIINIDECWALMRNPASAKQVDDMSRIIRGYSGGCILATQQIKDFSKCGEIGEDIIDNCAIKLILKNANLQNVKGLLKITDEDCERIAGYQKINRQGKRGNQGMLVTLDDKIELLLEPSEFEYQSLKDKTSV